MRHIVRFLGVLTLALSAEAFAACMEGQLSACFAGGVGGVQICSNGVLGPCVIPPSSCGGTRPAGSVLQAVTDDGSGAFTGLLCGAGNGTNKTCHACAAQWVYPNPRNGTVECRCL